MAEVESMSATTHAVKSTSTANAMADMPGMGQISMLASEASALVQSLSVQISSLRSRGQQNIQNIVQDINSQVAMVTDFARTNFIASDLLLPLTNFPEFRSDIQAAASNLQSLINSDVNYVNQELAMFASTTTSDVNAIAQSIGQVLSSLYGFTQQAVEVLLSSPLLMALPILNPALLIISAIFAADPSNLGTVSCVSALPSHHNAQNVAPIALSNGEIANLLAPLVAAPNPRADRDARREEHRKEWEQWAHQVGDNGVPNGTNFVSQILNGVSGIVDSALGPVYSLFGTQQ
ncbi:hypothetical protein FB645_000383 [Coemansia sp. IMI 203386]|nr:hypothetical protein FB645_000383 [Coemansia sp. IMI 203386]